MQRNRFVASTLALTLSMFVLNGCGGPDNSTGEIKPSPEAVKGDEAIQKAMKDMMSTKKSSKKTEAKPGTPKIETPPAP